MTAVEPTLPRVGDPAPDFTLPSTAGPAVTLSSFHGQANVVLAFFPLAFTSTCTAELCDFTNDFAQFEGLDTKVFGLSVDSVPALKAFQAQHDITVDLLSDFKREVCRRYGTLMEDTLFSRRTYVIIDKAGIVRWAFTEAELGQRRDNAELLAELEKLA
jgi:peroxiredoxin